jgi:gas vesicle protein
MNKLNLFLGFIGGAIIGTVATLFLAPESGEDTRKSIQKGYKQLNKMGEKEIKKLKKQYKKLNIDTKKEFEALSNKVVELGKKIIQ